jgi:hypothetical protein
LTGLKSRKMEMLFTLLIRLDPYHLKADQQDKNLVGE